MASPRYNFIYDKLVKSENDLIGLLAYGLYKRHKIEFIESFHQRHHRDPDESEFQQFYLSTAVNTQLSRYKDQAGALLDELSEELLAQQAKEIKQSIYAGSEAINEIRKLHRSTWQDIRTNIAATLITTVVTIALSVLIIAWSVGVDEMAKQVIIKLAEPKNEDHKP